VIQELDANQRVSSGYFLYLYQVPYFVDHPTHGGIILYLYSVLEFAQSQRTNGVLLVLGISDRALHIFNTQFHVWSLP
jgi:hypothetical protein